MEDFGGSHGQEDQQHCGQYVHGLHGRVDFDQGGTNSEL